MLLYPQWDRSCADCRRYEFDDEEDSPRRGEVERTRDGDPMPRATEPPCRRCPKVPADVIAERQRSGQRVTPDDAVEPEDRHRRTVRHFLECVSVGQFPDDEWVRRNAVLIRPLWKRAEDRPILDLAGAIRLLVSKVGHAR